MNNFIPIILCGGEGKRLWPVSNKNQPKQFITLFKKKSLFDLTIERVKILTSAKPIIITSKDNKKNISSVLKKQKLDAVVIYEEVGRNTATAVTLALMYVKENSPNSLVAIMPSDHFIADAISLKKTINSTFKNEKNYNWLLLGIEPNFPSTGFGYIETNSNKEIKKIKSFIEKPHLIKAKELLTQKNIFWNSGIFLGNSNKLLKSIKQYASDIYLKSNLAWKNKRNINTNQIHISKKFLEQIRSESIDKSVIEKETSKGMNIIKTYWSDVGSWDSISKLESVKVKNSKQIIEHGSKNNFIFSEKSKVVTIGVKDLIIISYNDIFLVIKKGHSEKIKYLIENNILE